jgi:hypothetical protein
MTISNNPVLTVRKDLVQDCEGFNGQGESLPMEQPANAEQRERT